MPKYEMNFDTQAGAIPYNVAIDPGEVLDDVLPDILAELNDNGYALRGWREGVGNVTVEWRNRELALDVPLPEQGVRPNEVLRVAISQPQLVLRRSGELYDIVERVELQEGDDLFIGRTILQFHISKTYKAALSKTHTMLQRVQQGRSFGQTVYFMALVGGWAGLCCWVLLELLGLASEAGGLFTQAAAPLTFALLGALVGGFSVWFDDQWLNAGVVPRWVLMGALCGGLGGLSGGLLQWLFPQDFTRDRAELFHALAWGLAGTLIGLGGSLRWWQSNRTRVLHALLGGLFGGLLGGLAFATLNHLDKVFLFPAKALGLILVGVGITAGISLAPILLRQGVLEFINSRDPVVVQKYAAAHKQWDLQEGGKYIIGSQSVVNTHTLFGPEVQIFLPDQQVAARHAQLIVRAGRYYLEPHPEIGLRPLPEARGRELSE